MKSIIRIIFISLLIPVVSKGQVNLNNIKDQTNNLLHGNKLSNDDVVKGLKEALNVGTNNGTASASKVNGYFGNPSIKIPFPPQAKKMETQLKSMGMSNQVNQFVMTINRAAETAAKDAAPIFLNAISHMTITDGMNILKGSDNAATTFLKQNTSNDLRSKFKPVIHAALIKVEVTKYWNPLVKTYNKIPFVQKQNPDLDEYVTLKALDGLFYLIAQEELKIRKDPLARVSDILKKVFGSL